MTTIVKKCIVFAAHRQHHHNLSSQGEVLATFGKARLNNETTPCPHKKGATDFFAITFTNMHRFLYDFWYTTLQMNTNHTGKFTTLRATYIPYLVT